MHPEYRLATAEEFDPVTDLEHHMGRRVHVEGWPKGYQFIYRKTVDGLHYLRAPTSKREYTTVRRLLKTKRQMMLEAIDNQKAVSHA